MELIDNRGRILREEYIKEKGKGDTEKANEYTEARFQLAILKNEIIDAVWK